MKPKELAKILNGRKYRNEMTDEEETIAKDNNLVVVFGASDDLLELRGVIYDELDAWDGETFSISKKLKVKGKGCNNIGCISDYARHIEKKNKIYAVWSPKNNEGNSYTSWHMQANFNHEIFHILEDNMLYCIGFVFSINDLN